MNFKNLPMKKDFNVFKIVLALLLVLGSQESVQGQFGMGGFGGYGYNPYSGMGRMRSSVPRTNVAAEPDAPLTAEEITELEMVKVKEALAIDPFEEAILRSILLEFTKKRIELQILKVDPKTLTESFRKLNDLENERLKTELSFATYEKLIELKERNFKKLKDNSEKKKKKKNYWIKLSLSFKMNDKEVKKNYLLKIKELRENNYYYFEKNNPKISDAKYDLLKKEIL